MATAVRTYQGERLADILTGLTPQQDIDVPAQCLRNALQRVLPAVATWSRQPLDTLHLCVRGDTLTIEGSDGYRLHVQRIGLPGQAAVYDALLTPDECRNVVAALRGVNETIRLALCCAGILLYHPSRGVMHLTNHGYTWVRTDHIIPDRGDQVVLCTVNAKALLVAVRASTGKPIKSSRVNYRGKRIAEVDCTPEHIWIGVDRNAQILVSNAVTGSAATTLVNQRPVGGLYSIQFNGRYVADILKHATAADSVTLRVRANDKTYATRVTTWTYVGRNGGDDGAYYLMPVTTPR